MYKAKQALPIFFFTKSISTSTFMSYTQEVLVFRSMDELQSGLWKTKLDTNVKPALVTTCLQQAHFLFPLKMVSHWNMY